MAADEPGARLRDEIRAAGISQRKIAEKIGVSAQAITNWLTGRSRPSWDHLVELEEILEVEPPHRLTDAFGYSRPDSGRKPISILGAIRTHPDLSAEEKRALLTIVRRFLPDERPQTDPPEGGLEPDLTDPAERELWALDDLTEDERRTYIARLRQQRARRQPVGRQHAG